MSLLGTFFAFSIFAIGIGTTVVTAVLAVLSLASNSFNEHTKQGTIILTTMGMSMIIVSSALFV